MLTLLRNAELYTPRHVGRRCLVLGGGKVLAVLEDAPVVSADLIQETVDLEGARVIPGLVDLHAHPTGGGGESGAETRVPAPSLTSYTRHGVTSIVGLLGTDGLTRSMQELLASVRALRALGLSAWCYTGGYHLPSCTLTGSLRGDLVHISEVIGIGELALSDFRSSQLTLDEFLRVASEAQVGGMVGGKAGLLHLHMGDGERGLELVRAALETSELPAVRFHPTHINRRLPLFEEALNLTRSGCSVDITAFPVGPSDDGLGAAAALERYLDHGCDPSRVTVSSDSGGCLPTFDADGSLRQMDVGSSAFLAEALSNMFNSGRAPDQFLPAFTQNPARLAGLQGKGELIPGSDADLVVLDSQAHVCCTMARGIWHISAGQALRTGPFETA